MIYNPIVKSTVSQRSNFKTLKNGSVYYPRISMVFGHEQSQERHLGDFLFYKIRMSTNIIESPWIVLFCYLIDVYCSEFYRYRISRIMSNNITLTVLLKQKRCILLNSIIDLNTDCRNMMLVVKGTLKYIKEFVYNYCIVCYINFIPNHSE